MFRKFSNKKDSGYDIEQSILIDSNGQKLNRIPSSDATSKTTYTVSFWVKGDAIPKGAGSTSNGVIKIYLSAGGHAANSGYTDFVAINAETEGDFTLDWHIAKTAGVEGRLQTVRKFRDPSAWIHLVFVFDTTNANPTERMRIYVNGERENEFSKENPVSIYPSQNFNSILWNSLSEGQYIGNYGYFDDPYYSNGHSPAMAYMSDFISIDGQALGPEHFALEDSDGVYNPIPYTGDYGTNGFHLEFKDSVPITEFKTPGDHTYTVPGGVESIDILVVSGGGGGGYAGGGGAGGLEYHEAIAVTPGQEIPLTVGSGGLGGASGSPSGLVGGASSIMNFTVPGGGFGSGSVIGGNGACGGGASAGQKDSPNTPGVGSMGGNGGSPDRTAYLPGTNTSAQPGGTGGGGMGGNGRRQENHGSGNAGGGNGLQRSGGGGDGVYYGDKFSDNFGESGWFCSGGAGGGYPNQSKAPNPMMGGGGGGYGGAYGSNPSPRGSSPAMNGTGGGGRGQAQTGYDSYSYGGDGVILIKTGQSINPGTDSSGNGNDFATSGITPDNIVADSPSNNYCTWNPLNVGGGSLSKGNLEWGISSGTGLLCMSSVSFDIASTTHKYYWEVLLNSGECTIGIAPLELRGSDTTRPGAYSYYNKNGYKYFGDASSSPYGDSFTSGDIIGIAVGGGTIEFFKNNVSQGVAWTGLTGTFVPFISEIICNVTANFGQRAFAYNPPEGYKALCTDNLPDTLVDPRKNFSVNLWSGVAGNQLTGFEPNLVWIKARDEAGMSHQLIDSVRGATKSISSNSTADEQTQANGLMSFNSDGFTAGAEAGYMSPSMVSWNFKAGGPAVTNNDGSIPSEVSVNKDMGFSVVKWNFSMQGMKTIGHGLGKAPDLIITKQTNLDSWWLVYSKPTGHDLALYLNSSSEATNALVWGSFTPNDKVFMYSEAAGDYIAYCFANTEMLQVGQYTGNGLVDGVFISLPFKPAFFLSKGLDGDDWMMLDDARSPSNSVNKSLAANDYKAEIDDPSKAVDFLSNGIKMRNADNGLNKFGRSYLYLAISEQSFKNSRGK